MSLATIRHHMNAVDTWTFHVPYDLLAETKFPFDEFRKMYDEDSFEAISCCIATLEEWYDRENKILSREKAFPLEDLREAKAVLDITLPYYDLNADGTVTAVPHDAKRTELPRIESLARAALYHGCEVSVFSNVLTCEPLYNAAEVLFEGKNINDLEPSGYQSKYKVSVFEGKAYHPPLFPSDIPDAPEPSIDRDDGVCPSP